MRKLSLGIPLLLILLFLRTSDSPHGKNFKMSCSDCHSSQGWTFDAKKSIFDHNKTSFALNGQHITLNCRTCHVSLEFTGVKTACVSCHTDMHEQTVGDDCARCHTTKTWLVSNITALHRAGRFPLVGAHAMADCQQCHKSQSLLRFDPMGILCVDCHASNFNSTTSPNHSTAGFSTDCSQCHKVNAYQWASTGFSHDFFPLTFGHNNLTCAQCHKSNNFTNISAVCSSCHQTTYNNTNNPNHAAAGFSTDCKQCHSTMPGWTPANYDHSAFPLTDGHNIACALCHINNNYNLTSTNCVDCHLALYNNTSNPNHQGAGFPTDCGICHSIKNWTSATFNHTWFPIYSGHHKQGVWNTCADCHTNATNYAVFTCTGCHGKTQTDNNHDGVSNYQYISTACYSCHPNGKGK